MNSYGMAEAQRNQQKLIIMSGKYGTKLMVVRSNRIRLFLALPIQVEEHSLGTKPLLG